MLIAIANRYMNAEKYGLNRIYFGGCFIRGHPATIATLSYAIRFWSKGTKRALFLRHEGFLYAPPRIAVLNRCSSAGSLQWCDRCMDQEHWWRPWIRHGRDVTFSPSIYLHPQGFGLAIHHRIFINCCRTCYNRNSNSRRYIGGLWSEHSEPRGMIFNNCKAKQAERWRRLSCSAATVTHALSYGRGGTSFFSDVIMCKRTGCIKIKNKWRLHWWDLFLHGCHGLAHLFVLYANLVLAVSTDRNWFSIYVVT